MAEGNSKVLCRYFVHGACKNGSDCSYSHDLKSAKPSMVCKYYQLGCCSYGDSCRYDHIKDSKATAKPAVKAAGSVCERGKSAVIKHTMEVSPSAFVPPVQLGARDTAASKMVTLRRHGEVEPSDGDGTDQTAVIAGKLSANEWVNATEFVPGQQWHGLTMPASYVEAAAGYQPAQYNGGYDYPSPYDSYDIPQQPAVSVTGELCPYMANGDCPYGANCQYVHGDICDMCQCAVLSPFDAEQRQQHESECMKQHEQDMELSFAVQRSQDKTCGICMDVVWQKEPASTRRFGILSNCQHVYCLDCIRKWRGARQFENKIIRACPECRVKSDFVTPSKYWVDAKEDKNKLIGDYKQALSTKPCKYFNEGKGECPFNDRCFYLHAYPDGRRASPKPVRRRFRQNADGEITVVRQIVLWDFLDDVDERRSAARLAAADFDDDLAGDDTINWQDFFRRLQLLGFALPSDDEDDDDDDDD